MANLKLIPVLRERTGAGMMDCRKALTETDGNMEAAIEVLKKSGAAKMEKKASRIAAEGITRVAIKDNTAVVTEVNSETDFVAKNETFQEFVQLVADNALVSGLNGGKNGEDIEALLEMNGLKDVLVEKTAVLSLIATRVIPSAAILEAFFSILAAPLFFKTSTAALISPSVSVNAFLQSIIPAPVNSRNSFTIAAVIAIVSSILPLFREN